jgi:REP-associated tyrosine transposase
VVHYRRNFAAGGTFFFTVNLRNRQCDWSVRHIDLLRLAIRGTRRTMPFTINAMVILPEHLHAIFRLPPGDADYAQRWRSIKSRFSRALAHAGAPVRKNDKGEYNVWQRRYWEHTVRYERDLAHHVDYIHFNPVKHVYAKRVSDWPHSSFHRYVLAGKLLGDWAGEMGDGQTSGYGE